MNDTIPSVSSSILKGNYLSHLLPFIQPYRKRIILASLFLIIAALTTLATPLLLRQIIDQGFAKAIAEHNNTYLLHTLFKLGLVVSLMALAAGARFMIVSWLGERVVSDIRSAVYSRLLMQPPYYFETLKTGEVLSRLTTDTTVIQTLVGSSLSMGIRNTLLVIGSIAMLFYTYPITTALVLLIIISIMGMVTVFSRRVRKLSRASQDRVADISSVAHETLNAITTVQANNQQLYESQRFALHVNHAFNTAMHRTRLRAIMMVFIMLAFSAALLLGLWLGANNVMNGKTTVGELTQFFVYALMVGSGIGVMAEVWGDIQRASGSSERLFELLAANPSITDPIDPYPFNLNHFGSLNKLNDSNNSNNSNDSNDVNNSDHLHQSIDIHFEDIQFSYPTRPEVMVLNHLNFAIKAGQRVALVGLSGAGKTTVFALLQRFYEPLSGSIRIAGIPINQLRLNDLRQLISIVPQEPVIFSDNFANNIRYGAMHANLDAIIAAAKSAQLHDFIISLPNGYDTDLGERGIRLSGGQKQRLAIARAILRNTPILLLDEATAALDASNELEVQTALNTAMENKTVLIIAHRLSTVQYCNTIYVFDAGKIIQTGSHQELMMQPGLYQRLAQLQAL